MSVSCRSLPVCVVILSVLLSGCLGPGSGGDGGGGVSFTPSEETPNHGTFIVAALDVDASRAPGEDASYEDATVTITLTARNAGDAASNEFVTIIVNGAVAITKRVVLDAGAERAFTHTFAPGAPGSVDVEARAGAARESASITLEPRARTGERVETPALHAVLNHVDLPDTGRGAVNLTLTNPQDVEHITDARIRLLCTHATTGDVEEAGSTWMDWPAPGNETVTEVAVPVCPADTTASAVNIALQTWDGDRFTLRWLL